MSSSKLGKESSVVEVTNISANGIWVLVNNEELFLAHEEFPWFKQAAVEHVLDVQQASPGHLYWPRLDIDLGLETIKEPQRFPLKAAVHE